MALGIKNIYHHNMQLTKTLLDGLATYKDSIEIIGDYSVNHRSSIVVLKNAHHEKGSLADWLERAGIVVTNRAGTLRISLHFYNTAQQVGYLLETVEAWLK